MEILLVEFYKFLDIFSKAESNKLSKYRGNYDYYIRLKDRVELLYLELLRRMTQEESIKVEKYIRENLDKGFIVPSYFYYSLPILFIKKPTRGIRLYINYRRLNKISKRDVYPLLLINKTITRLLKNK